VTVARKPQYWMLRQLMLIVAILAFSIVTLPVERAMAYQDGATPTGVGSLDDYMRQGQPSERSYSPSGPRSSNGGQGYYGAPAAGSRSQMSSAVMGAMIIALWALQQHQQRHQRHAARSNQRVGRSRIFNLGNPIQSPLGF
jgi:hypothetical protein